MWEVDAEQGGEGTARRPRRVAAGTPPPTDPDHWRDGGTFQWAQADATLKAFAEGALRGQELTLAGDPIIVRHGVGDRGLPQPETSVEARFAIDLTDSRRTLDGALLLFVGADGRAAGWRAERGMMTIWIGEDPELTELAPGAPERLTLVGSASGV